jgi:hypothetical protein
VNGFSAKSDQISKHQHDLAKPQPFLGARFLQGRDEALGTSAFRAFVNMMHKAWLVRLSAGKPHPLIAFLVNRLFG